MLEQLGATVVPTSDGLTVRGPGTLHGVDVDLHDVGELTPTLAALAALADSPSRLRGVAHIRGHETDRLAALATELTALGGDVKETADGLEIRPAPLRGGDLPGTPTPTTGWPRRARSSGWSCRAWSSTTSPAPPRRPDFPARTS